jgi:hypothetical protein
VRPVDRPDLRQALAALAAEPGDAEARAALFAGLLTGTLLEALSEDAVPTGLLFTGDEPLAGLGATGPKAVVRLPEYWRFLAEQGVTSCTIDAAGPVAGVLDAADLAALAEGRAPDHGVLVAPHAPVPPEVTEAVAAAGEHPAVRAAYVLEGRGSPGTRLLVAALELEPGAAVEQVWPDPVTAGDGWRLSAIAVAAWEVGLIRAAGVEPAFYRPA